jgi:putative alpha-1,2-mannosidase
LLLPSRAHAIGTSLLLIKEQGGDIPRWPIATVYSGCMIGNHAGIILAELGLKKLLSDEEIGVAYTASRAAVTSNRVHCGRDGWQTYAELGYLPTGK